MTTPASIQQGDCLFAEPTAPASSESPMTITALAPWFGGKRTLASRIVSELGPHRAYWEPFCGSMAVLLAKPESSHETVNDLNGNLINLARVIQDTRQGSMLYRRLRRVVCDEKQRDEAIALLEKSPTGVDGAFAYFIASWFGRNGFSGTKGELNSSFAVRWTPNGGHGGQRFASAVRSIPAWRKRIRRVTILSRNAFDVVRSISDEAGVVIYVDPPYVVKNAAYIHDFTDDDHKQLAEELSRFKIARVVVSYYDHPMLDRLYLGWTKVDCTITKGIHNSGKRGQESKKAPEVLFINGPSYSSPTAAKPQE